MRGGASKRAKEERNLFWQINFMLLSGVDYSFQMFHEARALARQIGSRLVGQRTQELSTCSLKSETVSGWRKG